VGNDDTVAAAFDAPVLPLGCWIHKSSGQLRFNNANESTPEQTQVLVCELCQLGIDDSSFRSTMPGAIAATVPATTETLAQEVTATVQQNITGTTALFTTHEGPQTFITILGVPLLEAEFASIVAAICVLVLIIVIIVWCCCRCCCSDRNCIHCCARSIPTCAECYHNMSTTSCVQNACCLGPEAIDNWNKARQSTSTPTEGEPSAQELEMVTIQTSLPPDAYPPSQYGPDSEVFDVKTPPGELGLFFVPGSIFVGGFFASSVAHTTTMGIQAGDRIVVVDDIDVEQLQFQEFIQLMYGSRYEHSRQLKIVRGGTKKAPLRARSATRFQEGLYSSVRVPIPHGGVHLKFFDDARPGVFVISSISFLSPEGVVQEVPRQHRPDVRSGDMLFDVCGLAVEGLEDEAVQSMLLQSNEQQFRYITVLRQRTVPTPVPALPKQTTYESEAHLLPHRQTRRQRKDRTAEAHTMANVPTHLERDIYIGVLFSSMTIDIIVMHGESGRSSALRTQLHKSFSSAVEYYHGVQHDSRPKTESRRRVAHRSSNTATPRLPQLDVENTPAWGNKRSGRATNLAQELEHLDADSGPGSYTLWLRALCELRRTHGDLRDRRELWVQPYTQLGLPSLQDAALHVLPSALRSIRSTIRDCIDEIVNAEHSSRARSKSRVRTPTPASRRHSKSRSRYGDGRSGRSKRWEQDERVTIAFGLNPAVLRQCKHLHRRDRPQALVEKYFPGQSGITPDHLCAAVDFVLGTDHSDYSDPRCIARLVEANADVPVNVFVLVWSFGFTSAAGYRARPKHGELELLNSFSIAEGRLDIVGKVFHYIKGRIEKQILERGSSGSSSRSRSRHGHRHRHGDVNHLVSAAEWEDARASVQLQLRDWARAIVKARKARKEPNSPTRRRGSDAASRHDYAGWTFDVPVGAGPHFQVPMSVDKYLELSDMVFTAIVDGMAQAYMSCDFTSVTNNAPSAGPAPTILIVGAKKPRVPLLLSRVVSKVHQLHRDLYGSKSRRSRSRSNVFHLVNAKRDCMARGAAIYACIRRQMKQTGQATSKARRRANVARALNRQSRPRTRQQDTRATAIHHSQSLDDDVVTAVPQSDTSVDDATTPGVSGAPEEDLALGKTWAKAFVKLPHFD